MHSPSPTRQTGLPKSLPFPLEVHSPDSRMGSSSADGAAPFCDAAGVALHPKSA